MRIYVTFDLTDDEGLVDCDHETGLTDDGYTRLHDALARIGADDIEVSVDPIGER